MLREKLKCPDQWCVLLADGVQTHVTTTLLLWLWINKIYLALRTPNTSTKTQNEDLVTFHEFRNSAEFGYNKVRGGGGGRGGVCGVAKRERGVILCSSLPCPHIHHHIFHTHTHTHTPFS